MRNGYMPILRSIRRDTLRSRDGGVSREQKGVARLIAGCCSVESGKRDAGATGARRGGERVGGRDARRESERVNVSDDDEESDGDRRCRGRYIGFLRRSLLFPLSSSPSRRDFPCVRVTPGSGKCNRALLSCATMPETSASRSWWTRRGNWPNYWWRQISSRTTFIDVFKNYTSWWKHVEKILSYSFVLL